MRGRRVRGGKRKDGFNKADMTGSVDTTCRCIKKKIGTLRRRILDKDTRRGTRLKFMRCVRAKPRITRTSKALKFRVVRNCTK